MNNPIQAKKIEVTISLKENNNFEEMKIMQIL